MSRFEYRHNGREVSLIATGSLMETVAEIGYMIQSIYNGLKTQNPRAAKAFKSAIKAIVTDDAPTWQEPERHDGETMIAMVQEH